MHLIISTSPITSTKPASFFPLFPPVLYAHELCKSHTPNASKLASTVVRQEPTLSAHCPRGHTSTMALRKLCTVCIVSCALLGSISSRMCGARCFNCSLNHSKSRSFSCFEALFCCPFQLKQKQRKELSVSTNQ